MSTVRSEPLKDSPRSTPRPYVSWNRIASVLSWLIGVWLTYLFLRSFQGDPINGIGAIAIATIGQALLTLGERPLWRWILRRRGGRFVLASVGLTLLDGAVNAGGLYPYVHLLSGSNVVAMFADAFDLQPTIERRTALLLAAGIGLLVAAMAELFWELDERG